MTGYPEWEDFRNSIFVRHKFYPRLAEDMPTFLGVPQARSAADLKGTDVVIIGAPFAAGWARNMPASTNRNGSPDRSEYVSSRSGMAPICRTSTSTLATC